MGTSKVSPKEMTIIQTPEGPRLTNYRPPWLVTERHRPRQETKTKSAPSIEKKKVNKEVNQSASMNTRVKVDHE